MALKSFKQHFGENTSAHFVFNGTAGNVIALSTLVRSFESVICTDIAHLNLDECGAPEKFIGCKLITVPHKNGKLSSEQIIQQLKRRGDQHHSQPRAVSITQPTEIGTVYSVEELKALSKTCKENQLKLHVDGARYIVAAHSLGLSLKQMTDVIQPDALSFGGTKNGLLFGEAVILFNHLAKHDIRYIRKQAMQLPSKMRFVSAQFIKLLEIWPNIAKHEYDMAHYLYEQVKHIAEMEVAYPVQANSVFAKIPKAWTKPLKNTAFFYVWDEEQWIMRWMCSFNTSTQDIDLFVSQINKLKAI